MVLLFTYFDGNTIRISYVFRLRGLIAKMLISGAILRDLNNLVEAYELVIAVLSKVICTVSLSIQSHFFLNLLSVPVSLFDILFALFTDITHYCIGKLN